VSSDEPVPAEKPAPEIRALGADQHALLTDIDQWAFGFDTEDLDHRPFLAMIEWDRTFGAWLGDPERLAGVTTAMDLDLPVPGGSVPCGGLALVAVHPAERRRGVMSALMEHHLRAVRERGEPVSGLHAAEQAIYGRFGYGLASRHFRLTLPRGAELRDVPGADAVRLRLERADADAHADLVAACYNAARLNRPGMVSRLRESHQRWPFVDQVWMRKDAETLRLLLAESDDGGPPRGYALFRRKGDWADDVPDGKVEVRELIVRDAAAARALWGTLVDLDLTGSVSTDDRPMDDPLLHQLVDFRAGKPRLIDGIWLRLVDVAEALAARRYSTEVDVVLEVTDPLLGENAGRWQLKGGPDGAACVRTDSKPDLAIDIRELGTVYLGSVTLDALAGAGQLTELKDGALAPASRAFSWPVAAYCGWGF